jgi:hypothetical protein
MRPVTDNDINCAVRRILVQHWLDLGQITIRTTRGVVCIHGTVAKVRDPQAHVTWDQIAAIGGMIQRLHGVRRVQLDLSNPVSHVPPTTATPAPASSAVGGSVMEAQLGHPA